MQSTDLLLRDTRPLSRPRAIRSDRCEDGPFATLCRGFRHHGGVVPGDEVASWMRVRDEQPISTLARWIVDRDIVHVAWQGTTLLPWFQFDLDRMVPKPIVIAVVRELRDAYDDWEMALWFVTANPCIDGDVPVNALASRPSDVLAAARTDRFVGVGLG